jgi:DNA repair exonuclease SbcCD nuclease subunit
MAGVRLLLFGDTHFGLDLPVRPRVPGRRRGEAFFEAAGRVLTAAHQLGVHAVIHGGDVFNRSRPPPAVVDRAYALLCDAAARGPPLFVVCGNHERARLPPSLFLRHERLFVFDRPRTFVVEAAGRRVALSGAPFVRAARRDVPAIAARLWAERPRADRHVLCLHQAFEGASVGPADFVFRDREDTVRTRDLRGWDAVFSGHIHRRQVLWPAERAPPVCYAGAVERTSSAELGEPKGFFVVTLPEDDAPLSPRCFRFHRLAARGDRTGPTQEHPQAHVGPPPIG